MCSLPSLIHIFLGVCVSQAYDQHLNMILGDVEETVTTVEIDEETYEELYKVQHGVSPCYSLLSAYWAATVVVLQAPQQVWTCTELCGKRVWSSCVSQSDTVGCLREYWGNTIREAGSNDRSTSQTQQHFR